MSTQGTEAVDTGLFRPARPRRAFDEIISQIRQLLDSGKIRPGDRLPSERALAERFSVSRNTVREAFRMLEISGLITMRRGAKGGAFITRTDPVDIADIASNLKLTDFSLEDLSEAMRQMFGLVLNVAGPRLTASDFSALEQVQERAEQLAGEQNRADRINVLLEFYSNLATATGNPILVVLMNSMLDILRRVVPLLRTTDHGFVIDAHRRVIQHLRQKRFEPAREELDDFLVDLHSRWMRDSEQSSRARCMAARSASPSSTYQDPSTTE